MGEVSLELPCCGPPAMEAGLSTITPNMSCYFPAYLTLLCGDFSFFDRGLYVNP